MARKLRRGTMAEAIHLASAPAAGLRIDQRKMPSQRGASEALDLRLAPRGGKRNGGSGPDDFRVIAVGDDQPAAFRKEGWGFHAVTVEMRREPPVEAIAMVEVVDPLGV